jgi:putative transposase
MSSWLHTTRFTRRKLPHWEVRSGRYFVTVRCADSLPRAVVDRLRVIHETLQDIEARSEQFVALQRQYFLTMEKHLHAGHGQCVLAHTDAARIVATELTALDEWQIDVPHYSIMPNHWHAMLIPQTQSRSLGDIMRRVKGRSARAINASLRKTGPLWQPEWFDRWMRNETEYEKCVRYIRNNPVKAGLVSSEGEHPWTK